MKKGLAACAVDFESAPRVTLFSRLLEVFGEEQALPQLSRLLGYLEAPSPEVWGEIEAHALAFSGRAV